jgi:hypothetical protein
MQVAKDSIVQKDAGRELVRLAHEAEEQLKLTLSLQTIHFCENIIAYHVNSSIDVFYFCSSVSQKTGRVFKCRRINWLRHLERTEEMKNLNKLLVGNTEDNRLPCIH